MVVNISNGIVQDAIHLGHLCPGRLQETLMSMRQLTPTHGQDLEPDCWKCTNCDQLFWTSNDSSHKHPPARVWAHFHQHSCEAFHLISRWLTGATRFTASDRPATLPLHGGDRRQDQDKYRQGASQILAFAKRVARRISSSSLPAGPLAQKISTEKASNESDQAQAEAKTGASQLH